MSDLVKIIKMVSPQYLQKFNKVVPGTDVDRPDTLMYKEDPKEVKIIKWLEKNALFQVREPWEGLSHNDLGYFFQGEYGTSCIICPKYVQLDPPCPLNLMNSSVNQDINCEWQLIIRNQPSNKDMPHEVYTALENMGFEKVSNFRKPQYR
jgi:hypothetical protein